MTSAIPGAGRDPLLSGRDLSIRASAVRAMLAHARAELPNECCGLLVGSSHEIDYVVTARNLKASPTRFLLDPVDHFAAIRQARRVGLSVVGAYHSHPTGPPTPSAVDLAEATLGSEISVIVSPGGSGEVAAYCFDGAAYTRITLRVTG